MGGGVVVSLAFCACFWLVCCFGFVLGVLVVATLACCVATFVDARMFWKVLAYAVFVAFVGFVECCIPLTCAPKEQHHNKQANHTANQLYLSYKTPLSRPFTASGFIEASAKVASEFQDMLIDPLQHIVKRRVECEIFTPILLQAGYDPIKAQIRLNWGSPETPEITASDLISAAEKQLIRPEEFRKNAIKILGWELWTD